MKGNCFITGLENKLRTIRRKYKIIGRTKIIVWTMCYQFTSYQFEETSRAFIKTNLDFADQGKRRSQRLYSKNRHRNQFRKLVSRSDSKVLSFENELVRKVIVTTKCYCDLLFMYLIEYLWIFVWYIYISLYVMCKIVM